MHGMIEATTKTTVGNNRQTIFHRFKNGTIITNYDHIIKQFKEAGHLADRQQQRQRGNTSAYIPHVQDNLEPIRLHTNPYFNLRVNPNDDPWTRDSHDNSSDSPDNSSDDSLISPPSDWVRQAWDNDNDNI